MFNDVYSKIANFFVGNDWDPQPTEPSPVDIIKNELREPRPMPIGLKEFHAWADRIIQGAMVKADVESQKFALASMLTQLGSKDTFKDDLFFITNLRRSATEQTAQYVMKEIKEAQALRRTTSQNQNLNQGAVTPPPGAPDEVLRDGIVQGTREPVGTKTH